MNAHDFNAMPSMRPRRMRVAIAAATLLLVLPVAARAGLADWQGHMGVGYAKLFTDEAPGGNLSMSAGIDHSVVPSLRVGVDIGYHLLGSRTVQRGSLFANVDYSAFEAEVMAHWLPARGPFTRISAGPGLMSAHADLSTSGGGAGFGDLAVSESKPGVAFDATWMSRKPAPVRLGLEIGARVAFLDEQWTIGTLRLTVHY